MVTLTEAALACYGYIPGRQRGPQDATLQLADVSIGEERAKQNAEIARANVSRAMLDATYELEGLATNLRAYTRGMISAASARGYIAEAREALAKMEAALAGAAEVAR